MILMLIAIFVLETHHARHEPIMKFVDKQLIRLKANNNRSFARPFGKKDARLLSNQKTVGSIPGHVKKPFIFCKSFFELGKITLKKALFLLLLFVIVDKYVLFILPFTMHIFVILCHHSGSKNSTVYSSQIEYSIEHLSFQKRSIESRKLYLF